MFTVALLDIAQHLAAGPTIEILAAPEPVPQPPPGMEEKTNLFLGWMKWGGIIAGIAGFMIAGIMMVVGRRNRSSLAADGASGLPWIVGGLSVVALAGGIVGAVLPS
ncbi:hypothetical protein [Polymorphospora sp. NPDC050346]|uniref:hypothetical protein n=1 Tax=Polymorphospora sp. NPDC050346 TaxID=3155780 RepID=UPI0033DBDCCB